MLVTSATATEAPETSQSTCVALVTTHDSQPVSSALLPVPAVYIVNKEGTVTYRYFDENYKKRVSVAEILKNIK